VADLVMVGSPSMPDATATTVVAVSCAAARTRTAVALHDRNRSGVAYLIGMERRDRRFFD
jgi:hypothetical protein